MTLQHSAVGLSRENRNGSVADVKRAQSREGGWVGTGGEASEYFIPQKTFLPPALSSLYIIHPMMVECEAMGNQTINVLSHGRDRERQTKRFCA